MLFHSENSEEDIAFISNYFELGSLDIPNVYRNRLLVKVFFKCIKQNNTIKRFLGCSENAEETHLWVAASTYLIVARIKATFLSPYTILEILLIIHVSAFEKTNLKDLISQLVDSLISNQDFKEPIYLINKCNL